jgi:orotate phosphoribosyltransferase
MGFRAGKYYEKRGVKALGDFYTQSELAKIARRENNNKRKYLVVNPLQGKHIPVSPHKTLKLFESLAGLVGERYSGEKLLVIGFAETATAIGVHMAISLGAELIQTTRENVSGAEYLYFTESHSHATEQRLVCNGLGEAIKRCDRIVFAEDEITTGKTIGKIAGIIRRKYGDVKITAASLLNGMDSECLEAYRRENIDTLYLVKIDNSDFTATAEKYSGNGEYFKPCRDRLNVKPAEISLLGCTDSRTLTSGGEYLKFCERLWETVSREIVDFSGKTLVLGSEEFMYPSIYIGSKIQQTGGEVSCHATTRSPIEVSCEEGYPLRKRWELVSLYDKNRRTFVYQLEKYDRAVIVTDSAEIPKEGLNSLVNAVYESGTEKIYLVKCK